MSAAGRTLDERLARAQRRLLGIGLIGALLAVGAFFWDGEALLQSYFLSYQFWLAIPLGSLALLMLHHMVGGRWGFAIRRFLEAATRTFPLLLVAFVPIWLALERLYPWAHPDHELTGGKDVYLEADFFLIRTVFYFAIWIGFSFLLDRGSRQQDEGETPGLLRRLQLLSGPGLLLFGLTSTFSAVDWVMSLEYEWYSTIYGAIFITGQGVSGLTVAILVYFFCRHHEPFSRLQSPERFHDLGNLFLAFVLLWAYMSFSQYLIIWYGDLPEETPWYLHRSQGGWELVALGLVLFHLVLPLTLLLARRNKRRPERLVQIAVLVLVMRFVDLLWIVMPAFSPDQIRLHVFDLVTWAALGGLWGAWYLGQLRARPLLAFGDERFELKGAPKHA